MNANSRTAWARAVLTFLMTGMLALSLMPRASAEVGRDVGEGGKDAGKGIGKGGKDAGKGIGKGGKDAGKGIGKGGKDVGKGFKKAVGP